jgi:hypothetical protein
MTGEAMSDESEQEDDGLIPLNRFRLNGLPRAPKDSEPPPGRKWVENRPKR